MRRDGYWTATRAPRYSLMFALPLLLLYEGLAAALTAGPYGGVRNGADVILKALFSAALGRVGPAVFGVALIGGAVALAARDIRVRGRPRAVFFAGMALEVAVLAVAFGVVVGMATAELLHGLSMLSLGSGPIGDLGPWARLMVSLGAGLYEELLFRVLLVTLIATGARLVLGWGPRPAGGAAAIASALAFSAVHYVGPYGDRFSTESFAFRAVAGLFFSALYVVRGFGITAWTHALYDAFLLVV